MPKTTTDNFIWPLLVGTVFIVFLVVEVTLGLAPEHLLGSNAFWKGLGWFKTVVGPCWMLGSLPVGVIGIVFSKRTGKLRFLTIIASIINIIAGGIMLALFALIIARAITGQIHV